jgi:hypothetical protein
MVEPEPVLGRWSLSADSGEGMSLTGQCEETRLLVVLRVLARARRYTGGPAPANNGVLQCVF